MNEFFKKSTVWNYVVGSLALGYGIYIVTTGEAGCLISAGEGRYWFGGVLIAFGLYFIISTVTADLKKRQK